MDASNITSDSTWHHFAREAKLSKNEWLELRSPKNWTFIGFGLMYHEWMVWVNYTKLKLTANTAPEHFFLEIHRLIHGGFSSLSC